MSRETRSVSRRHVLMGLGATFAALPLAHLLGCESGSESMGAGSPELLDDAGGDVSSDASASDAARSDAGNTEGADGGGVLTGWATGGTAAMLAKASYPNPFAHDAGSSCELACEATIGPCHTTAPLRSDVSDGWDGLPMRMALRVVDPDCKPVVGTLLSADNVIGGETDKSPYLFDVTKLSDGAMMASKTLVLRASLSATVCTAKGAGGAGAMGGMGGPMGGMGLVGMPDGGRPGAPP